MPIGDPPPYQPPKITAAPDVMGRCWSLPPDCTCDGFYYRQHEDPGCPHYVRPQRGLRDRLWAAWQALFL